MSRADRLYTVAKKGISKVLLSTPRAISVDLFWMLILQNCRLTAAAKRNDLDVNFLR